jgi:two-component system response regulator NreC
MIRVLIADDHAVVRSGLRSILERDRGLEVVGESADGIETLEKVEALRPDVLLLDITMPPESGIETARELHRQKSLVRVVFLTVHEDEELLREALTTGAAGYVVKRAEPSEILQAIHSSVSGHLYVHPSMTRFLLDRPKVPRHPERPIVEALTPRELEVVGLLVEGNTNREVAGLLGLSVRTVENHRANLMGKLGLASRAELVTYAREHALVRPRPGPGEPRASG